MNKHLKIAVLIIIMLIYSIGIIYPQTNQYDFKHITTRQNLSSNTVYSMLQDSRGFFWFGTSVGLCRYDGYTIKVFLTDPSDSSSISGNIIWSNLVEDGYGNLWVGTLGNGMNKYNRLTGKFTRFKFEAGDEGSISHNKVYAILQDSSGNIWAGTEYGLNKLNDSKEKFNHFLPKHDSPQHPANKILSLYEDSKGVLWVGTREGVYTFDRKKKKYYLFNPKNQPAEEITNKLIYSIHEDVNCNLWFGTSCGLYKYDRNNSNLIHFFSDETEDNSLSNNTINHIFEDPFYKDEYLWISSAFGLNKLDINSGKVLRIYHNPDDPGSIGSNSIYVTYIDENGKLWAATEHAGISYTDLTTNQFNYIHIEPQLPDLTGYSATTFMEDDNENLWVGTREGGLFKYNPQLKLISNYEDDIFDKNSLSFSFIFNLVLESDNNLLISTVGEGLFRFNLLSSDLDNFSFRNTDSIFIRPIIREVYQDNNGSLWVGTRKGLYYSRKDIKDTLQLINDSILSTSEIHALYEVRSNGFWVGTIGQGLFYLPNDNPENLEYIQFKNVPGDKNSISNDIVVCIYEDSQNRLWIGTNNGLNQYISEDSCFIRYFSPENPGANFIYYIQEDKSGNLWMTTQAGLVRFNPKGSGKNKFRVYTVDDGLPFDNVYPHFIYSSNEGRIFVGGNQESGNGFFWFHPDSLKENTRIPPLAITDFRVRNEAMYLDSNINEIKHIKLAYHQNYFSFEFSTLNFINPEKNQYAYMLEGLDNDWIYSGTRRFVSYSSIKPGNYIFRVKGANNDGYWNDNGKSIRITISPPPWKTWWAYLLYALFVIGLIYSWRRYDLKRQRLKQELEVEQVEAEKLKELDTLKSRFFANISHEFRTPLTLILGPIEKLRLYLKDEEPVENLNMMQRNALRLQNLINQLLNLSKLEGGKMKLQTQEVNIVSLVNRCVESFESLAKQKSIELDFKSDKKNIPLYVDQDMIEKIFNNLLSNSFKFTAESGRIEIKVTHHASHISIVVSDNGLGIPPEKLSHIFDRFYQVDDTYVKDQQGTGIGLALTKELVELHYGKISVESQHGKGSKFNVLLPLGKEHLKEKEIAVRKDSSGEPGESTFAKEKVVKSVKELYQTDAEANQDYLIDDDVDEEGSKPLLLVVEDNIDLRSYIRSCLIENYRISEATDGEMGLKKAIDKIPDLIISDVMMPKMDGYEFCRQLKTNECTNHIPVILLTAKAGIENKLEGLETGADDFLTKPFNTEELQVRIRNLIQLRRKLRSQFIKEFNQYHGLQDKVELSMDQKFIHNAKRIVEEYLSDPDFSVEFFGQEMALSRSQLHRKLSAILDQSPIEFIRTIRLNRAAILLAQKSATVAEIAYDVGFNNPSYFAECFRKQFGKLPSEYAN